MCGRIFGSQHGTQRKPFPVVRIMGNRNAVRLAVIHHGMYARHFATAYAVHPQFVGCTRLRTAHRTIRCRKRTLHPFVFTTDGMDQVFGQRNGRPARRIQLMHMVHFLHPHIVGRKTGHDVRQITVYSPEDSHAEAEVAAPEKRMSLFATQAAYFFAMFGYPSRTARHHFYPGGKSLQIIVVCRLGCSKLDSHICTPESFRSEVFAVVDVDDTHYFMATFQSDLLYHVTHLAIAN